MGGSMGPGAVINSTILESESIPADKKDSQARNEVIGLAGIFF